MFQKSSKGKNRMIIRNSKYNSTWKLLRKNLFVNFGKIKSNPAGIAYLLSISQPLLRQSEVQDSRVEDPSNER